MPRIFDNMNQSLLPELKKTLVGANRADFCVGYINLRGWKTLEQEIEQFVGGEDFCCRLLVGMQKSPKDELQTLFSFSQNSNEMYREKSIELNDFPFSSNKIKKSEELTFERINCPSLFFNSF